MIRSFKNWFKGMCCTDELSLSEKEALLSAQAIQEEGIMKLNDDLQLYKKKVFSLEKELISTEHLKNQEIERLQKMCSSLTESAEKYREELKRRKKKNKHRTEIKQQELASVSDNRKG